MIARNVSTITDPWFWDALYNTAWFALVSGLPQHLVAVPLAFFIHRRFKRGRDLVVGAYFVPYITSSVAIALIFTTLYSKDYGLINAAVGLVLDVVELADLGVAAAKQLGISRVTVRKAITDQARRDGSEYPKRAEA